MYVGFMPQFMATLTGKLMNNAFYCIVFRHGVMFSSEKSGMVFSGIKPEHAPSCRWPINRATTRQGFHLNFGEIGGASAGYIWGSTLDIQGTSKTLLRCSLQPFTVPFWAIVCCVFFFFASPCCDFSAGCSAVLRAGFAGLGLLLKVV